MKIDNIRSSSTKNISLTLKYSIYSELKDYVPQGKLSSLANSLFEEYLKEKRKKKLIESYKRISLSKSRKEIYEITEGSIEDGIE